MPVTMQLSFLGNASTPERYAVRREWVFLILAGIFLGTLCLLNVLGISRFLKITEINGFVLAFAVGVLPYPATFLCTDLISEFYGKARANRLVWIGVLLNLWIIFVMWVGGLVPGFEERSADGELLRDAAGRLPLYFELQTLTMGAVTASMIAYLCAQFIDVRLFHFWKRLTAGRHLWLRNNASTLVSQLVDTTAVILVTHYLAGAVPIVAEQPLLPQLMFYIATGYAIKLIIALFDTALIYPLVAFLKSFLAYDPVTETDLASAVKVASDVTAK